MGGAGLTAAMARGADRRYRDDGLLARSAIISEVATFIDENRDRSTSLLDHLPGWLLLAVVAAIGAAELLFTTWQ